MTLTDKEDTKRFGKFIDVPYRIKGERKWRWVIGCIETSYYEPKNEIVRRLFDETTQRYLKSLDNIEHILIRQESSCNLLSVTAGVIDITENISIRSNCRDLTLGIDPPVLSHTPQLNNLWCFGKFLALGCHPIDIGTLRLPPKSGVVISHISVRSTTNILALKDFMNKNNKARIELR